MDSITTKELLFWMSDGFGDWIDGDDPVADSKITKLNSDHCQIYVVFESGKQFKIDVVEVENVPIHE
jgi:hypothetical protein